MVKTLVVLFVLAFILGMICLLGRTVPGVRGAIYDAAKVVFPDPVADQFLRETDTDTDHHDEHSDSTESAREISFSPTAAKNLGIDDSTITEITVGEYYKTLAVPAVVTERPGHSSINVPAPLSGVITKVYHENGVAVGTGEPLFDILVNRQELIQSQNDYIALLKALEINESERERLSVLDAGIAPQKKRELAFEQERLAVELANSKRTLELMGLPSEQLVESLEKNRELVKSVTVFVPAVPDEETIESSPNKENRERILTLDKLNVCVGQNITLGDSLCQLTDLRRLVIQGKVFASDESRISTARREKSRVAAVFNATGTRERVEDLVIRSIDNRVDTENGIVYSYVDLVNQFEYYEVPATPDGTNGTRRYIQWRFRPGQRCELQVEYEKIPDCIVLPVDALAQDIGEQCVFEWVGNEEDKQIWRKVPVHVLDKTKDVVAIANDGSILPGTKVATKGAGFILAALTDANQKAAGGGGVQHGDHIH